MSCFLKSFQSRSWGEKRKCHGAVHGTCPLIVVFIYSEILTEQESFGASLKHTCAELRLLGGAAAVQEGPRRPGHIRTLKGFVVAELGVPEPAPSGVVCGACCTAQVI